MKNFKSFITEASVMKPDYVPGHKFVWKGDGVKEFGNYKKGDVFAVVAPSDDVVLVGKEDGEYEKYLQAPDGKVFLFKGGLSYKSSSFTHLKSAGSPPSGAEWENLIVYAYNNLKNTSTDEETAEVALKYWDMYGDTAVKIAQNFDKDLSARQLVQTGKGLDNVKLGKFWKEAGATNKTPKTDIASANFNEKISLKKEGGSQLASAEQKEAIAIVRSALSEMGNNKKFASDLVSAMEEKMGRLLSNESVDALSKRSAGGADDEAVIDYQKKDQDHKELSEMLADYINGNKSANGLFAKHIVLEAATGNNKFGSPDAKAAANILGKFSIKDYSVEVDEIKSIESPIIVSYAKKVRPYVAFKKGGANSPAYSAMRLGLKEEESSFKGILLSELSQMDEMNNLLTEDFLDEGVLSMIGKAGNWAKNLGRDVWKKFSKIIENVMQKVKKVLQKIAKRGKMLFEALMKFFGVQVAYANGIVSDISL